ncbi:hypothetical protein TREMEDRAFT_33515 [Tremella mesenterica DSM 1558]|uniref:uncharacterized protein n=1 Tax=Tremella mesenterica (strain ATCC 24925 / CBS 8224 / DSM 1558 / NBRC 9311 / NRRL Y-6157 / RJB 2259-6 / UBC 559-6) TaxID=578456 RepID=UPI0003F48CA3|nr:uncharacterized protein TREMEDRAFT_33515 [Tremella mesenterica DSM 1558]EIW67684.1 hypothetical protein TREMEDRAFT_33515 [Tremella mesenterica DSM 1558]
MVTRIVQAALALLRVTDFWYSPTHAPQSQQQPIPHPPTPTRPLEWRDVNFLSISDTHGWLLGHQHQTWPEPNYSAGYGSFASFVIHMREEARRKGVDLLLIDAGDHHDGSGLVSSSPQSAARADEIFAMLPYDVMTIGNHELYKYSVAKQLYDQRDMWGARYLTSNVNITIEEDGEVVSVPIGERVAKFTTDMGNRVTAFGVIFDFKAHGRNITIQHPEFLAKETWFLEAIEDTPDYFVLAGHMPARGDESAQFGPVYQAVRHRHPHVPIYIFGGHTHMRDCVQFDNRSIAVVPGRYMETVAFTSSTLPDQNDTHTALNVSRRYLDASRQSSLSNCFPTHYQPLGIDVILSLLHLAGEYNISQPLALAPQDYFLSRYNPANRKSLLRLYGEEVLPTALTDEKRKGPRVIIANAGSVRFDLFQGRFDKNDELTVSPFDNDFVYTRLPAGLAKRIHEEMERAGASKFLPSSPGYIEAGVEDTYNAWMSEQWSSYLFQHIKGGGTEQTALESVSENTPTMGYVTHDACPGKGDDIEHVPGESSSRRSHFVSSTFPMMNDEEELDVVVMSFSLDDFLTAVHTLDPNSNLTEKDFKPYAEHVTVKDVFGIYARKKWKHGD